MWVKIDRKGLCFTIRVKRNVIPTFMDNEFFVCNPKPVVGKAFGSVEAVKIPGTVLARHCGVHNPNPSVRDSPVNEIANSPKKPKRDRGHNSTNKNTPDNDSYPLYEEPYRLDNHYPCPPVVLTVWSPTFRAPAATFPGISFILEHLEDWGSCGSIDKD
ncbi:hypothetical protein BDV34DRAFT_233667 [Aspergillus parasiticus]|uniref:Uncharacterized protein n=1 Tax=Aspergillus parasiticus TaxID=5067 RepID=A0A5N6DST7_ASPPA|nr:hypothetical protein BDV34DRAFT_233667 [Aspergillus parasiticus]